MREFSRQIAAFYEGVDVWVSPTLGIPPFPLGYLRSGRDTSIEEVLARDSGVFTALTWPANMTGQPALSYPVYENREGLPIGIQIAGRYGADETVIGLAAQLERIGLRGSSARIPGR